jgi:hypothetical protein
VSSRGDAALSGTQEKPLVPWVKLTDDWYDDCDLVEAGPVPLMLWPLLISWSARNLTDGRVPVQQVRRLVDWSVLPVTAEQAIASLVDAGRLEHLGDRVQIVNYLRFQPSKEKVLADRERDRERKARSRPGGVRTESDENRNAPVPVPVPGAISSSSSCNQRGEDAPADDETQAAEQVPTAVWQLYADRRMAVAKNVTNPKGYRAKCIENGKKELGGRALELWATYDIDPSKLADALVAAGPVPWLNHIPKREAS